MNKSKEWLERLNKDKNWREVHLERKAGDEVRKEVLLCTNGVTFKEAVKMLNEYYKKVKMWAAFEDEKEKENSNEQ